MASWPAVQHARVGHNDVCSTPRAKPSRCLRCIAAAPCRAADSPAHAEPTHRPPRWRLLLRSAARGRARRERPRGRFRLADVRYTYRRPPAGGESADAFSPAGRDGSRARLGPRAERYMAQLDHSSHSSPTPATPVLLDMWEVVNVCRRRHSCAGRGSAANSLSLRAGHHLVAPDTSTCCSSASCRARANEPPDIDLDIEHDGALESSKHV